MENFDCKQEFNSKYEEALAKLRKRPNILEGNLQNSNSISPRKNAHISARECLRRRRLCLLSELQKNGLTFIFTGL